jgi:hypothetical protein
MHNKLQNHIKDLKQMGFERRAWLMLSAFVVFSIGFIIYGAAQLEQLHLLWIIGTIGLLISMIWWYWSMRIINKLVVHREEEIAVLNDLCSDIKEVRQEVREIKTRTLD